MTAVDASRHLWTARVDPRRRTYATGLYTHVRDRSGLFYDQPMVLNERQAGVIVEGVEQHNRAEDRIRISLLAVDRIWPVPEKLEGVTVLRVLVKAIERGWDDLVRLAASIRAGKVSAAHAIHRLGSAAVGDPLHRAAEHLGRLLRTLFLCDYLAIPDYRREIHTLLNRESQSTSCSAQFMAARWPPSGAVGGRSWRPSRARRPVDQHRAGLEHESHGRCRGATPS